MNTPVDSMTTKTERKTGFGYGPASLSRSSRIKLAIVSLGVLTIGIAGWTTMTWVRSANEIAGITRYTVTAQSFSVLLSEKGELSASNSTDIISKVEGRTTIISLIPEGTQVKEGDLLIVLASDQIDERMQRYEEKETNTITAFEASRTELEIQRDKNASDIRKAQLRIELNKLELEKYEKGVWTQIRKDARIAIDQAKITLERRTQDFEAGKQLRERDFITKTEYDEYEFNHQKAIWNLEKAEKAKEVLERYTHVADLRQRQSDVEEAIKEFGRTQKNAEAEETKKTRSLEGKKKELDLIRNQLVKIREQKKNCNIYAPNNGFVVYYSGGGRHFMSSDNQIREGATVHERQILLSLPDTSEMMVIVRVHEAKTDKLEIGQRTKIKIEGIPGKQFAGTVTKIAALADSSNRWLNPDLKEYETEITLDPSDVPLKPGVTAYVEIMVETVDHKLAIPVQAIYSKNARRYVFRKGGANADFVEVKLGAIGTNWAEVVEGLAARDQILLAFGNEEKRAIPDLGIDNRRSKMGGRAAKKLHKQSGGSNSAMHGQHKGNYQKNQSHSGSNYQPKRGNKSSTSSNSHQGK